LAAPHARHGIVAAAKTASCRYLLNEDLQEGLEIDGVVVVNPFRTQSGKLWALQ
jgi:predicted nucleic acid-binding protein